MLSILMLVVLQCPDGTPPPCRAAAAPRPAARANSVAVLYFENNSPDTGDVYLADGLTDELITQLGRIERLSIAPRSAVRRYRGHAEDLVSVSRGLGVSHLVSGSVRRAGTRLRVDVELVRMPAQTRLWGESYQRTDGDIFAIQEDIARAVTQAVTGTLLPAERAQLARAPTRDRIAYDLYLRASASLADVSPAAVQRMRTGFEEALRRDPSFTGARGRLAFLYAWSVNWSLPIDGMTNAQIIQRGLELADRALREDSTSSDAWVGRAFALFLSDRPDYDGALAAIRRAVALDSNNSWARNNYATILRRLGYLDEGVREYQAGLALTPDFSQSIADIGFVQLQRRRYAESLRWYDSSLTIEPGSWANLRYRARIHLLLGDTAAAERDSRASIALVNPTSAHIAQAARSAMLASQGDTAEARAMIGPILARFTDGPLSVRDGSELAMALAVAGRSAEALDILERTRPHGPWLWTYLVFPEFDAIRGEPRFQRIFTTSKPPAAPNLP